VYVYAVDKEASLLVGLLHNPSTQDDFDRLLETTTRLDTECATHPEGTAQILVLGPGFPRPDPNTRRRLAEVKATLRARRRIFALVTDSVLLRGVAIAVNWISPPPPGNREEASTHPNFDAAARWLEERRGSRLPILWELYKRVAAGDARAGGAP
jgi:hypothetical protein